MFESSYTFADRNIYKTHFRSDSMPHAEYRFLSSGAKSDYKSH